QSIFFGNASQKILCPPLCGVLTPPRPPNKSLSGTHGPGFETELGQPRLRSGHHPTTAPSQPHCLAPVVPSGGGVGDAAVLHVGGGWGAAPQAEEVGFDQSRVRSQDLCVQSSPSWEKGLGDKGKRHLTAISTTFA
ncbi:MAG: hypothetical protein NW220_13755, partial [Leptolyngbyaceae cyanobacterium bins.349]|nr:hypothetical protein [Leptolyngbyaceae cyanobacterium bins.349]